MPLYNPVTSTGGVAPGLHPTYNPSNGGTNFSFGQIGFYGLYVAESAATITKAECFLPFIQASSTIEIGIYDYTSLSLLASGTAVTGSTAAVYLTVTLASTTLTRGGHYWYAILNRTAESTTQLLAMSGQNNVIYTFTLGSKTALDATLPTSGRSSTTQVPYIMFY
jgi:hypothetical protein